MPPEACPFLNSGLLFQTLAVERFFFHPAADADELDLRARFDVLIAEKASVRTVPSGSPTKVS